MPAARKRKAASTVDAAPVVEEAAEGKSTADNENVVVAKLTIEACKSWQV